MKISVWAALERESSEPGHARFVSLPSGPFLKCSTSPGGGYKESQIFAPPGRSHETRGIHGRRRCASVHFLLLARGAMRAGMRRKLFETWNGQEHVAAELSRQNSSFLVLLANEAPFPKKETKQSFKHHALDTAPASVMILAAPAELK